MLLVWLVVMSLNVAMVKLTRDIQDRGRCTRRIRVNTRRPDFNRRGVISARLTGIHEDEPDDGTIDAIEPA